jgi:hypothetical protein
LPHDTFPFDKLVPVILDPEMVEDTAEIVRKGLKDKVQVKLFINNRAGGNAFPDCGENSEKAPCGEKGGVLFSFPCPFPAS